MTRLRELPGVTGVAAMSGLPPNRQVNANDTDFEGYTPHARAAGRRTSTTTRPSRSTT